MSTAPTSRPSCPNNVGGTCLGDLKAGTYETTSFTPDLSYTVPADGWANMEDLAGNFLLLPPGSNLAGIDAGTADYLGVYTSVAAPDGCTDTPLRDGAPTSAQTFAEWLGQQAGLEVSEPQPATIGRYSGVAVDIAATGEMPCSDADFHFLPVLVGVDPSSVSHAVIPGYPLRLYLLDHADGILAIEIADAPNGGSDSTAWFADASDVAEGFKFTP